MYLGQWMAGKKKCRKSYFRPKVGIPEDGISAFRKSQTPISLRIDHVKALIIV